MNTPAQSRGTRLVRGIGLLVALAAVTTLTIAVVERGTRERIAANRAEQAARIVAEVLPGLEYDNVPGLDYTTVTAPKTLGSREPLRIYTARRDGRQVGTAVTVVAPDGYVGPIRLLVGLDTAGRVLGVRVLEHRETPGLGDRIEASRSDWLSGFAGRSLGGEDSDWMLATDGGRFDHISGATITSRAVVRAVANALRFHAAFRSQAGAGELLSEYRTRD